MAAEPPALGTTPDAAALEAEWRAALLAKNKSALEALIHPAFELVAMRVTGPVSVDRAAWLEALERMDIDTVQTRLVRQVVLPHTIVATMDACWKVRYRGQTIDERVMVTDVWVREDGRWQVLRRHSSLIPAGAKIG